MRTSRFTLIEVILAVSMFVVGITAVLGVYQTSAKALREARREQELTEMLKQVAAQVELIVAEDGQLSNGELQGELQGRPTQYTWTVTVEDAPLPQLRQVRIEVTRPIDDAKQAVSTYLPILELEERP